MSRPITTELTTTAAQHNSSTLRKKWVGLAWRWVCGVQSITRSSVRVKTVRKVEIFFTHTKKQTKTTENSVENKYEML